MFAESVPADTGRNLDPNDPFDGLTSKQQVYASLSFSGLSDVEAYRRAYECAGMTEASVRRRAADVAHNPMVRAKLRQMQDTRDAKTTLAAGLTREWITQRLMGLADHAEKDTVKVTSLIALGKIAGIDLFRETTRTEHITRTVEDIDRELVTHLKALQPMIEGKANSADLTPKPGAQRDRRRKPQDGRAKIKP